MVDVVEEGVERPHALLEPADSRPHSLDIEDARDDVEGDQPLRGLALAVDGEGDADAAEDSSASCILVASAEAGASSSQRWIPWYLASTPPGPSIS